jgi:hypothetical protein
MLNRDEKLYRIEESFGLKQKAATFTLLILMSTALLFMPLSQVKGQSSSIVYIYQITKQSGYQALTSATVGEAVAVDATLFTYNGAYKLWFGDTLVDDNTSTGYYVRSNFTIPEGPAGNYTVTLMDVAQSLNGTAQFTVAILYSAKAIVPSTPAQLQEGNTVVLNVTIAGGQPNTAYSANITVMLPSPLATNYSKIIPLTSSSFGTANAQINFPDSSFLPSGSTTVYTGSYTVFFNATEALAQDSFFVGFTDASTYHRGDTVKIRAVDYPPGQSATLAIQSQGGGVVSTKAVTASSQGIITYEWAVLSTTALGTYTVNITTPTVTKTVADSQTFTVPGYPIIFRARNLAGDPVSQIVVEALDQATNTVSNETTYINGVAIINLEKGSHTVGAYWNQVKVGEIKISVTGNNTHDITCQLTNLKITVQDKNGIVISFVNLNLTYQFTTRTGSVETGSAYGQTDLTGTYTFNSTLPGISYVVNASKYDIVFNLGNNTISSLPAQSSSQASILCPDKTLTLTMVDYNLATLPNVRIELVEQASAIFYGATADNAGAASVRVTFGQYKLSVYTADNILLNETIINVISDTHSQIRCVLYNLQVTVKVVDYFGNPISNVNVQMSRSGINPQSKPTQGDGTATFDNVVGGNIEITAFSSGNENSYVARNLEVDSSTVVPLQMANYVVIGGLLIGTSLLATIIIVLVAVLLFLGIELYKKKGFKLLRKSESKDVQS